MLLKRKVFIKNMGDGIDQITYTYVYIYYDRPIDLTDSEYDYKLIKDAGFYEVTGMAGQFFQHIAGLRVVGKRAIVTIRSGYDV